MGQSYHYATLHAPWRVIEPPQKAPRDGWIWVLVGTHAPVMRNGDGDDEVQIVALWAAEPGVPGGGARRPADGVGVVNDDNDPRCTAVVNADYDPRCTAVVYLHWSEEPRAGAHTLSYTRQEFVPGAKALTWAARAVLDLAAERGARLTKLEASVCDLMMGSDTWRWRS